MKGNSLENVSKILSANGKWSIDESGKLTVKETETEKLKVKSEVEFGSPEKPIGVTVYDKVTKDPYCLEIESGEVARRKGKCE